MEQDPELQAAQRKRQEEAQQRAAQEAQLRSVLRQTMDTAAYERLQNIRLSNPDMYGQVVKLLVYLVQQGQLKGKVSEEQLKQLVAKIVGQRREGTITYARK